MLLLCNGATITFGTDYKTRDYCSINPFNTISNTEDVYVDPETIILTVTSTTGGGFNSVSTTDSVDVNVIDTIDTVTVSLAAKSVVADEVAEGAEQTYSDATGILQKQMRILESSNILQH